jgi:hypothetical protein
VGSEGDGSQGTAEDADCQSKQGGQKPKAEPQVTYTPIKALSTFTNDWRIKARVTKKHEMRHWKNAKSEGKLLNIELMDQHGT